MSSGDAKARTSSLLTDEQVQARLALDARPTIEPSGRAALFAALAKAQAEMPAVDKDGVNPHFKSKFTTLDHLIAKTRPVLNKHGLAISQYPRRGVDGMPELRTRITHCDGGEIVEDMQLLPGKPDMQGIGAAISYARRFAWAAACGIASETDDDGESIAQHNAPAATSSPRTAAKPPEGTADTPKAQNASQGVGLITEKQMKLVGAVLRKLGDGGVLDEDGYRAKLNEMNVDSTRELTGPQASTLIDWLKELEAAMDVEL